MSPEAFFKVEIRLKMSEILASHVEKEVKKLERRWRSSKDTSPVQTMAIKTNCRWNCWAIETVALSECLRSVKGNWHFDNSRVILWGKSQLSRLSKSVVLADNIPFSTYSSIPSGTACHQHVPWLKSRTGDDFWNNGKVNFGLNLLI